MSIPRSPLLIERAIDRLFDGSGPKALIARMICRDGRFTKKTMPKLEDSLKEEFPKEFKSLKRGLVSLVSEIETSLTRYFDQKKAEAILQIERIVSANKLDAYFVGDYPREMVLSGSCLGVKDIEVFSEDKKAAKVLESIEYPVTIHSKTPNAELVPYMALAGCDDAPFNRFAFSRGLTVDSLGMKVGSNEILDPSKRGVSDALAGRISSTLPPSMVAKSDKPIAFTAVRIASRTGFEIDNSLKTAIRKCKGKFQSVSNERLLIEKFTLSKCPEASKMLSELGLGDNQ